MSLPGFDLEGNPEPVKARGEYDRIAGQIIGPTNAPYGGKNRVTAALMQVILFFIGGGYFYLDEKKRGLICAASFILGVAFILGLEMLVFPTEIQLNQQLMPLHYLAVAIALCLGVAVYPYTVYDCYRIGKAREKLAQGHGIELDKSRKPNADERLEQLVREHDKGRS